MLAHAMLTLEAYMISGPAFIVGSWLGMLLCGIAANTTPDRDCLIKHWLYQCNFVLVAFALGWGTVYGADRYWEPWPPHLALVWALDIFLALRFMRHAVFTYRTNGGRVSAL